MLLTPVNSPSLISNTRSTLFSESSITFGSTLDPNIADRPATDLGERRTTRGSLSLGSRRRTKSRKKYRAEHDRQRRCPPPYDASCATPARHRRLDSTTTSADKAFDKLEEPVQ